MPHGNVELVRRASEAAFRRPEPDWKTLGELYDPAHKFHSLVEEVDGPHPPGAEGWSDWLRRMDETGEWGVEIEDVLPAPDGRVVVVTHFWWRGTASGLYQEQRPTGVVTVRAGKIVRTDAYESPEKALEAAGVAG